VKVLGVKIVNEARGKQIALGHNTTVFVIVEHEDGELDELDISTVVRAADVRLHLGEPVTAKLEVFVTGLEARAAIEEILLRELKPRRGLWRRLRDVSTFGRRDGAAEYAR